MMIAMLVAALVPPADIPFDADARAGLPAVSASITAHGTTQQCSGVRLADLAARAGLPAGKALSGPPLAWAIVAEAGDGYRVAFTLAEIDPLLGNRPVVVADRCNGAALSPDAGPIRLVVPGEARAARSLRGLVRLRLAVLP